MSLDTALSIAASGLYAVQGQIAVVSQNVANANTAGYVEEVAADREVVAAGQPVGVRIGPATRLTAPELQANLYAQNSAVAEQTTLSAACTGLTSVLGSTSADTGSSASLTDQLSSLQSALTNLEADPGSQTQVATVVAAAGTLCGDLHTVAANATSLRQSAADGAVSDVADIGKDLASIGALSTQIVTLRSAGVSTAGLEDQRDAAMTALSGAIGVVFTASDNGAMTVRTTDGLLLPTDPARGTLSLSTGTISASDSHPGTIGGIMLNGVDVTARLSGGSLGANLALRDTVIPTAQAELDSLAATVATRFSAAGLTLFTDANGALPGASLTASSPAGIVGFAQDISVSPTVTATPQLVASGDAGGAGSQSLVSNIVTYAFGTSASAGVAQPASPSGGLGPTGTLTLPYQGDGSLSDLAAKLVAAQGQSASNAGDALADASALQTSLGTAVSSATAVSVDGEMAKMVALQNSYTANAKIVSAVQSMFNALLQAVAS